MDKIIKALLANNPFTGHPVAFAKLGDRLLGVELRGGDWQYGVCYEKAVWELINPEIWEKHSPNDTEKRLESKGIGVLFGSWIRYRTDFGAIHGVARQCLKPKDGADVDWFDEPQILKLETPLEKGQRFSGAAIGALAARAEAHTPTTTKPT